MIDESQQERAARKRLAGAVTAVAAVGSAAGWLFATVFEYLQWSTASRWTLHGAVVLLAVTGLAALASYVWRDEVAEDTEQGSD